jgi:hypothetical protein
MANNGGFDSERLADAVRERVGDAIRERVREAIRERLRELRGS